MQRPRGTVCMKKVRNIRWHTVLIDTLKTETSNFVLNPSLHWKPVECSQECCCTFMQNFNVLFKKTSMSSVTLAYESTYMTFLSL